MTDTFAPPVAPSPGQTTQKTVTGNIRRAEFGDNYSQRAPDGLNAVKRQLMLSWPALVSTDCATIESFFLAEGSGATAFFYTPYLESTALKWTCSTWTKGYVDGDIVSLEATLVQEFDVGA